MSAHSEGGDELSAVVAQDLVFHETSKVAPYLNLPVLLSLRAASVGD